MATVAANLTPSEVQEIQNTTNFSSSGRFKLVQQDILGESYTRYRARSYYYDFEQKLFWVTDAMYLQDGCKGVDFKSENFTSVTSADAGIDAPRPYASQAQIRQWALSIGLITSTRGVLSKQIVDAYFEQLAD